VRTTLARLSTNFAFIPRTVAEPPSAFRARAYAEGGVILGPDADPEGWKVYDPIKITGTLFGTREVSVQCTVSDPFDLAVVTTPLSEEATYAACDSDTRAFITISLSHHRCDTNYTTSSRSRAILLSLSFSPSTARPRKRSICFPALPICASYGPSRLARKPPMRAAHGGATTRLFRAWQVLCSGRTSRIPAPLPTDWKGTRMRMREWQQLRASLAYGLYEENFSSRRGRSSHSRFRDLLAR
jgi:hypothetical protein